MGVRWFDRYTELAGRSVSLNAVRVYGHALDTTGRWHRCIAGHVVSRGG